MGAFDLAAARKSGATDEQIAQYLGGQYGYDTAAALKAGATPKQLAEHLAANPTNPTSPKAFGAIDSIGLRAVKNAPSDFWNLMKEFAGTVTHPKRTLSGLSTLVHGAQETVAPNLFPKLAELQRQQGIDNKPAFQEFVRPITESIKNPAGVPARLGEYTAEKPAHALLGLSALMRGGGKVLGSEKLTEAGTLLDPLNAAMKVGAGAAKGTGYLGRQALGFTTGKRFPIVDSVYKTLKAGGEPAATALKYLKGKLEAEDAIGVYKGALKGIRDDQMQTYTSQLKDLANKTNVAIDMTPLKNRLTEKLYDYGVAAGAKGKLDFSRSKAFAADTAAQADVTKITEIIRGWGKKANDTSPFMMDTLRGILDDFYSPSGKAREFVASIKGVVKDEIIKKVPEYKSMLEAFEKRQEIFEDSKKLFSMKNPNDRRVNADLVLKKLQRAMQEDPDFARDFISKVEKESGKDIKSIIAAYSMAPMLPGGIVGRGMLGGTLYETARGSFDPHLLVMMGAASPRYVGEFLNIMAKTSRAAGAVRKATKASTGPRQAVTAAGIASEKGQQKEQE